MDGRIENVVAATMLERRTKNDAGRPIQFGKKFIAGGKGLEAVLIGLPNTGCSTLYNALTDTETPASPFLAETQHAARAVVNLKDDEPFKSMCEARQSEHRLPLCLQVTDSPVRLLEEGNVDIWQEARSADIIFLVLRAFQGKNVTHMLRTVDPARDLRHIGELMREHDISVLQREIIASTKLLWHGGSWVQLRHELLERALEFLLGKEDEDEPKESTPPAAALRLTDWNDLDRQFLSELGLLSEKPLLLLLNVSLRHYITKTPYTGCDQNALLKEAAKLGLSFNETITPFSAALEQRLSVLRRSNNPDALFHYTQANPAHRTALPSILRLPFKLLDLITVYTCCKHEHTQAWAVKDGTTILQFAKGVHECIARYFVSADVIDYDDFRAFDFCEDELRRRGKLRRLGADVILEDRQILFLTFVLS